MIDLNQKYMSRWILIFNEFLKIATKNRMEGKEDMKCYDWFFCTKKLDKETIIKTVMKK